MTIILTSKLRAHLAKLGETSLTVDIIKKRSNCCAVGTPKARAGAPNQNQMDKYDYFTLEEFHIYVEKNAPLLEDKLTFDFNQLFVLSMIEVHGIDFQRML